MANLLLYEMVFVNSNNRNEVYDHGVRLCTFVFSIMMDLMLFDSPILIIDLSVLGVATCVRSCLVVLYFEFLGAFGYKHNARNNGVRIFLVIFFRTSV